MLSFKLKISEVEVKIEEYKKELNDLRKTNKEAIEELIFEHNNSLQELLSKTREEIEDAKNFVHYDKRNKVEQTEEYQKVFDEAMTELLSLNPNINEYDRFKKQCFEKRGIIFEK